MKINGDIILLKESICLYNFLLLKGYNINKIAVEINKKIIDPQNYKNIQLYNTDIIEILNFVGGG